MRIFLFDYCAGGA